MLIQLEIENFRSFKEKQSFSTVQRSVKRFPDHVHEHSSGLKIMKTTGIYGANGSGKTNLFKALYCIKNLVSDENYLLNIEAIKYFTPFLLSDKSASKPSKISVDFIAKNDCIYSYSVEILPQAKVILSEKLVRNDLEKEVLIFNRFPNSGKITIDAPSDSIINEMKALLPNLISNASLFLSYELFEHEDLDAARDWFMNKIEFLFPTYEFHDIAYIFTLRPEYLDLANGIIKISNVGIEKLELYKVPIELYLGLDQKDLVKQIIAILQENSFHSFKDYMGNYCTAIKDNDGKISIVKLICYHENEYKSLIPFDVDQESRGTIVLLHLIPALIRSYGEGINYFLDDINTSLHPVLLKEILGQYLSLNLGQAKGQLIFNSHEDFLMDEKIIRQDELWLMEKNNGASIIFPLTDFPNVRFDLNLRKNYLNGKFGAVPFESEPQKIVFGE